jgi:TATA-binding protein-associated factor Taf7
MIKKGKAKGEKASGRGSSHRGQDCPESEEVKELEARCKELKGRLKKATNPSERRRLEQEIKVVDWRLQRLRVRPYTPHT